MTAVNIIKNVLGSLPKKVEKSKVLFEFKSKEILLIDYLGTSNEFQVFDDFWYDIKDEDYELPLFETKDLMIFPHFEELNECEDCNGEGYTNEFIGCSKPASECCGGCTEWVECKCENRYYRL